VWTIGTERTRRIEAAVGAEMAFVWLAGRAVAVSADNIVTALRESGLEKVVAQSTYGAQPGERCGDLNVLYDFEQALKAQTMPVSIQRAANYMSNWDGMLEPARDGILPSLFPEDFVLPMVAPEDLGRMAADGLREPVGTEAVHYSEGPQRWSVRDVADAFANALGRPVRVQVTPREKWVATFRSLGFSDEAALVCADDRRHARRRRLARKSGTRPGHRAAVYPGPGGAGRTVRHRPRCGRGQGRRIMASRLVWVILGGFLIGSAIATSPVTGGYGLRSVLPPAPAPSASGISSVPGNRQRGEAVPAALTRLHSGPGAHGPDGITAHKRIGFGEQERFTQRETLQVAGTTFPPVLGERRSQSPRRPYSGRKSILSPGSCSSGKRGGESASD
jgi:uncharacterized protein YbjT (DUF2867 family)